MSAKLSDLTELAVEPDDGDLIYVVDISDTTDGAAGTSKRMQYQRVKNANWRLGGQAIGALKNLGSTDNFAIAFITNNTEAFRVDTSQQILVGMTSGATAKFNVQGAGANTAGGTQLFWLYGGSSPTAGNLYGAKITKTGYQDFFWGINKNTTTGEVPASALYISTYTTGGQVAIGRGNGAGNIDKADLLIDGSGNVNIPRRLHGMGGRRVMRRSHTGAGNVTVATTDFIVEVNKASGAATQVDLPATPTDGDTYIIKDGKGDAATNNITIVPNSGNIDGAANYVININYGRVGVTYNGTQWLVF